MILGWFTIPYYLERHNKLMALLFMGLFMFIATGVFIQAMRNINKEEQELLNKIKGAQENGQSTSV